jgi:integrating conjugative element protein (TIGR03759 family)
MADDTSKVLRFQDEYQLAFQRLYGKMVAVDLGQKRAQEFHVSTSAASSVSPGGAGGQSTVTTSDTLKGAMSRPAPVTPGDRVLVFTSASCVPCETTVRRAVAIAPTGVTVDLYIVDAKSVDDVRTYARQMALDPLLVQGGRVTLNLDNGTLAKVLPTNDRLPQVVRKRGDVLTRLAITDL